MEALIKSLITYKLQKLVLISILIKTIAVITIAVITGLL